MRARTRRRRLPAVGALAAVAILLAACDDPPTTVTTAVSYSCLIDSHNSLAGTTTGTTGFTYATEAPQAVAPAQEFDAKVVPAPFSFDGNPTSNGRVTQISNLVWKVAVPAGTDLEGATIADWANVGAGTPTVATTSSVVTVTVPGPMASSTTAAPNSITLPALSLKLKATGALQSKIALKISGTSTSSPGLTYAAKVTGTPIGTLNPTFSCFPNPSPVLHSTLVSNDTKAPAIAIKAPVKDQSIPKGATVKASFTCDDGTDGSGVASCVGTVANGAAIDTATVGPKAFTVTATDAQGLVGTQTVTYTVVS